MSADNWATCPRCFDREKAKHDEKMAELKAKYGKVSADEWSVISKRITERPDVDTETFREDWEIGMYEGIFEVSYSGRCEKCGLAHQFKHKSEINGYKEGGA